MKVAIVLSGMHQSFHPTLSQDHKHMKHVVVVVVVVVVVDDDEDVTRMWDAMYGLREALNRTSDPLQPACFFVKLS